MLQISKLTIIRIAVRSVYFIFACGIVALRNFVKVLIDDNRCNAIVTTNSATVEVDCFVWIIVIVKIISSS